MAIYTEVSPDVLGIAAEIISHHHPALLDAKIGFIFQDEASTKLGKIVLGNAQKISDKQKAAGLDMDYLITVALDMWQSLSLTQRKALIDHELCHCDYTLGEAKMRGHDIEEFQCIIDRYGLWKSDLREIAPSFQAAIQMRFDTPNGRVMGLDPKLAPAIAD